MKYSFGVDLNSRKVICVLLDEAGTMVDRQELYAEMYRGSAHVVSRLSDTLALMLKKGRISQADVTGIGIAMPTAAGYAGSSPLHFSGLEGADIPQLLSSASGLPVFLASYASATGFAEAWISRCSSGTLLSVDVFETLISSALISFDAAAPDGDCRDLNIGHMIVDHRGFECTCGRRGCLSVMGTGNAAVSFYEEFTKQRIGFEELKRRVQGRDILAVRAFDRCAQYISIAIINAISVCTPDKVCLGGDFLRDNEVIAAEVVRQIRANTTPAIDISLSPAGADSEAFGVAIIAMNKSK